MASSVIVVFGATGNKGGAVVRTLARDSRFKIRAVTRDPGSPKARELHSLGAEVVKCNLNEPASIAHALKHAYGVFLATYSDLEDPHCYQKELSQGLAVAEAAEKAGIQHVVFCSQLSMVRTLGIQCRLYDAKAEICDQMIRLRLPLTVVSVPFYYENLLGLFRPQKIEDGFYQLNIPMGSTSLDMMSVNDLGPIVNIVFQNRENFLSKTMSLSADKLTIKEMAQTLTAHLHPTVFRDRQMTPQELRDVGYPGCKDWANMFDFIQRVNQKRNVDTTKRLYNPLQNFEQWVYHNKDRLLSVL